MSGSLSYRVLGPLEVLRDGKPLELGAAKQRAVLGVLLVRRGQIARDVLIDALWGAEPPAGARNTLQVYVSRLRRLLGSDAIETGPNGYELRLEPGTVDADRFESSFREGRDRLVAGDAHGALELLSAALEHWRGAAYADLRYEAFAQAEAARLDELRLACLEERIDAELALGRHAALVGEVEALVREQPLRERPRGQLILALYRSGRQSEALAEYRGTRRMLADELGLEPSPALRALERMILAHDPGLAAPAAHSTPRSNLPLQPTPFIDREEELAAVVELLRNGSRRLVTLTGAGGAGKTRLAVEAGRQVTAWFPDGVWWVPLQSLPDPQLVPAAIAGALGASADLASEIGDRRMLLVLDNFEHVLDGATDVSGLLASCPGLVVLATSREPLHLAAEREYQLTPMDEPYAVELFVERAYETAPDSVVAAICRRVDCLPLAVELAAAHTRTLACEEILGGLDHSLTLLTGGPRDAPARHQTLHATIQWGYDLMTGPEQELFAQLSVFSDGCDVAAIEAVCGSSEGIDVLVDKSLVRRQAERYSLLRTIREFAAEKLDTTGQAREVRRRHAEHMLSLVERAARARAGELGADADDQPDQKLLAELPNLAEALAFALREDDLDLALRLAGLGEGGWNGWVQGGATLDGQVWLGRVLDRTGDLETTGRARALATLGALEEALGNLAAAEDLFEHARTLYELNADSRGVVETLLALAHLAQFRNDPEQTLAHIVAARSLADHATSFQRAQILFAEADAESNRGNYERADRLLGEGLELVRTANVPGRLWSWQLLNVAWSAIERDDLESARATLTEYLAEPGTKGPLARATVHGNLALVALFERNRDEAEEQLRLALVPAYEQGAKMHVAEALYGLAAVAAMDGDGERATRLWAAAGALQATGGVPVLDPVKRVVEMYLEPAAAGLADEVRARSWAEGSELTMDEAVAYALGETSAV
jgi:predicted ATPase/DNA-binding SARP family transcriptional activator